MDDGSKFNGAGGTPGGLVEFFIGLRMSIADAYLLTNQVTVTSGFWSYRGYNTFGLSLLPLSFGIGIFECDEQVQLNVCPFQGQAICFNLT